MRLTVFGPGRFFLQGTGIVDETITCKAPCLGARGADPRPAGSSARLATGETTTRPQEDRVVTAEGVERDARADVRN